MNNTRYQIVIAANGQSVLPVTLQERDAAIKIANDLSRALATQLDVLEIKPVHSTTVIVGPGSIVIPEGRND